MDVKNKMLLQHHQKDVVRDLDVTYIIDELFTNEAISTEDFDHIVNLTNRAERTRFLIDTLIQNGTNQSYETFVDSLSKDHRWLWEKFTLDNMKASMFNDSFEDSLSRGDVPRLPDHYVQREKLEQDVAAKLKLLTRHKILALHGMSGSGKTSVAIGALRDNPELITTNFNGVVFWLNFGNVKSDDDIVAQQSKLQRKATSMYSHRDSSFMNSSVSMSSIGSNADSQSLTSLDWSWQEFRDMLKTTFSSPALKEALLVLDEVNEKRVVEAFDVGCRLLATTRDTDVVANFNPQIVKVENNFEERESLQLFASCLDLDVSQLPRQAKKLNEICKGSPFHIALIGAQLAENKERLIHDTRHWSYYIDKLAKKDFFFLSRHSDNPMKTIEVCINSLKPAILPLFKKLAILPDNVKVTAKVLSKLWSKQITEVEAIMKQLRSKSLIIEFYDQEQRNYVYEVHDLIMNYLRTCHSEDDLKKLHVEFLKSYNFDKPKAELTDDGYIPFYIGHHIYHTGNLNGKWGLFKTFLDLKFLGSKVRLTGPADAIMDLQRYEALIAQDEIDRELLFHIKAYLSTHGNDLYRYPSTEIVQSILQYESKGILYSKALQIAQEHCAKNELYLEFLHEQNVEEIKHSTIDVKESISSVCFLGDYILVGTTRGIIKVFDIITNKLKKELLCTEAPVKWVSTCPVNALIVAALGADGVVKIWYMDDVDQEMSETREDESEENSYNGNFCAPVTISPKLGPFLNCRWMNSEEILITHTSKMIIIYGTDGKVTKVIDSFDRDRQVTCCIPTNDDKFVMVASYTNTTHYIEVFDLRTREKVIAFEETMPVINILSVPGTNRLLVINTTQVLEHEFKVHSASYAHAHTHTQSYNTYRSQPLVSSHDVTQDLSFVAAVVNKAGSLLFVSTDDSRIICIDLKTNSYVFDLDNRRGNVISMSVSEVWYDDFVPGSDVLLSATGCIENTVKVWYLDAAYVAHTTQKHRKVRLTTKFDVSFLQTASPQTPDHTPANDQPAVLTKRHQSFTLKEVEKKPAKKTMSLDRHSLKPLNLKGICGGLEEGVQPLLAVVDDRNNIQIIRGRKVLTEITSKTDDKINHVKISPCNQYVIFGLQSGTVKKYFLRSKETKVIMDIYSPVQFLKFVTPQLLVVAGKNRSLMAYMFHEGWRLQMLQKGSMNLGSQEILNDIQGNKKKNGQADSLSLSGSEASLASRERLFPSERPRASEASHLVECFWLPGAGLATVEDNGTVKLWAGPGAGGAGAGAGAGGALRAVLLGRQPGARVRCAALQRAVLALCDDYGKFQTFELKESGTNENKDYTLQTINESKVNFKIVCCALTADGHILAMGLDSGDVVLWNVPGRSQLHFLRHHKSKCQAVFFSPVPDRLYRSNSQVHSPNVFGSNPGYGSNAPGADDDQPPLTLVTMASEIVWWNVTYLMRMRSSNRGVWRTRANVLTPLASPLDNRSELTAALDNMSLGRPGNYFFGSGGCSPHACWEAIWKKKTCKEGSKRKEILACIKLAGMSAKRLSCDELFGCFVTVDYPGHIHIMNVLRPA